MRTCYHPSCLCGESTVRKELKRHGFSTGFMLVEKLVPIVMRYVVIEVTEREISGITLCASLEEGVQIANGLLRKLIEEDYELDMHTLAEDGAVGDDYMEASADEPCAWCNLKNTNWDAHVCETDALFGSPADTGMPAKVDVYALIHEQDTDSAWGSDIELSADRKALEAHMRACWENALESWDINPTAEQSDEYCWECGADSASIIDGSETERWRIEQQAIDLPTLLDDSVEDNSSMSEYNGQAFNTRISVEDLAQRAFDLKVGQTLFFKGNSCGDEVSADGTQINGVTGIKSNDLGMFALIFSVVGGGNSFMVDVTEYDKVRSPRAIADDIYHHYGNDIFV